MEINIVIFIWILYKFNFYFFERYEFSYNIIYYFFIQSLGSVVFFLSFRGLFENLINFSDWVICLSLSIKMGIFPFHFWVYKFGSASNVLHLFLLLTIQKLPLFFLLKNFYSQIILNLLFVSLILGSLLIFLSNKFKDLVISSSIYSRIWFYIFLLYSNFIFLFRFLFYRLAMIIVGLYYNSISIFKTNKFIVSILLFLLAGFPPFSLFFCKFYRMYYLFYLSKTFFFFLWLLSFLALAFYFIFFYFNLVQLDYIYKFFRKFKKRYFLIFFFSIYIFLFWVKLS